MRIPKRIVAAVIVVGFCGGYVVLGQNGDAPKKAAETTVTSNQTAQTLGETSKKPVDQQKRSAIPQNTMNSRPSDDPEEKNIRGRAETFVKLYCEHNSKGLAEVFAPKGELIGEDGTVVKGREEIERTYDVTFKNKPMTSMRVEIQSVRVLTPVLAIEEGTAFSKDSPDDPEEATVYVAIHVKQDGKWQLGCVRDWSLPARELTPHDRLERDLVWLVGEWVDESPDSVVSTTCKWNDNGNFLMQEFQVNVGGQIAMSGTMRIGWDAVAKQFKSWVFDSHGGHSTGAWTWDGDRWIVKTQGATVKGEVGSSTNYYRRVDGDTIAWGSFDRIIDGERLEDIAEIVVKRRPPLPTE
jgi:uncharacterized protein (TIGR02246 family)